VAARRRRFLPDCPHFSGTFPGKQRTFRRKPDTLSAFLDE